MFACSDFGEAEQVPGDLPDAATDGPAAIDSPSGVDASDAALLPEVHVPYCKTLDAAQICNEFPGPPVINGWVQFGNPEAGVAEWTNDAGATDPGAARFSVGPVGGTGATQRIYLSRGVPAAPPAPSRLRYEMSVNVEERPDVGYIGVVRLFTGRAIFYITLSQLGYTFTHGYYGNALCGAASAPCRGGDLVGTKPPILKDTWDRLSITIAKKAASDPTYDVVFESASGERIVAQAPAGFEPNIEVNAYLDVGFVIVNPAATGRTFLVDDVSLTVQ